MDYRSDLTGLRALAVAAVVFFHFGMPGFAGGFAGVDVFFVISGYLMTRIVAEGLAAGRFSFTAFYRSRAKRIVPALVVMCLAVLLVGLAFLGKRDYYTLSKHVVSSVLFLSNFTYLDDAGYFDADAHEKWFLHTWSLSVEWQFYLLYPVVLVAITRFMSTSGRVFRGMLWLLAALSFAASVIGTQYKPVDAFFLLPARAWELFAGGLVYMYAPRLSGLNGNRLVEVAGLVLIGLSITQMSGSTPWPGYASAMPVLGACLILLAAPKSFWISNPASQAVGKWSYSIYLWHWPLVVAAHYFDWHHGALGGAVLILASVVLGYLSYRFVEEPCRHSAFASSLTGPRVALMGMPVLVLGAIGIATKGLPVRLPAPVIAMETNPQHLRDKSDLCSQRQHMHGVNACLVGNMSAVPSVVVLGDSHAGAMMHAVKYAAEASNTKVMAILGAGCPPIAGIQGVVGIPGDGCKRYVESSLTVLDELDSVDSVVLIARWSVYLEGYSEKAGGPYALFGDRDEHSPDVRRQVYRRRLVDSLCGMAKRKQVYVVMPIPEQAKNIPREMARLMMTGSKEDFPSVSRIEYAIRNAVVLEAFDEASKTCGVMQLDPRPFLCGDIQCMGVIGGRPAYYDDDHLNEYGGILVKDMFRQVDVFGLRGSAPIQTVHPTSTNIRVSR